MFSVDGIEWPYPCTVERAAELKLSDISGLMMDGTIFNDVLGTYMQYRLKLAIPLTDMDAGNAIYEKLTEPVEGHTFIFPYNGTQSFVMSQYACNGLPWDESKVGVAYMYNNYFGAGMNTVVFQEMREKRSL